MIIKKRQLLLATLVIALAAAVFVNWYYTRPDIESADADVSSTTLPDAQEGVNLGDARYVISGDAMLDDTAAQAQASEYFESAKLRRRNAHDEAAESLNDIIKDGSSSSEAVSKATAALEELAKSIALTQTFFAFFNGQKQFFLDNRFCFAVINANRGCIVAGINS